MQYVTVDAPGVLGARMQQMAAEADAKRRRTKPALKVLTDYGVAIVALRKRRGMNQADLIAASKVAQRTASGAENSENIRIDTLDAMLAAMGASLFEFCLAVAAAQGIETPDVQSIEERERQRDKYKARVSSDIPLPSDPHQPTLRMLQDRIADLEARLYGVTPSVPFTPKGKPD